MPSPWSEQEVSLAVEDYFAMLLKELRGEKYVKLEHNKALAAKLNDRSKGSVEFKHENISAVLLEMGLPYIDGYKPRKNIQGILRETVADYVNRRAEDLLKAGAIVEEQPIAPPVPADWLSVVVDPPAYIPHAEQTRTFAPGDHGKTLDFAGRESKNRKLGYAGEQFVMEYEVFRLERLGKPDLARNVEWVSRKDDTAGFDILSFDDQSEARFIEVKTTKYARSFPFIISRNEVECSATHSEQYCLYRLFTFTTNPRFFVLHGDVKAHCQLEPVAYRAGFGGAA